MFGYAGRILRVDLTREDLQPELFDDATAREFMGGRCLGSKILFDELKPGVDPLGPENKLVVATGPTVGIPFSGNSRYVIMSKSPLTGGWGESNASGFFGPELKFAGFDVLVISGVASHPVYLWIHDQQAEIRDASPIWGKVTGETQDSILKDVGDPKTRVACIGPGGENKVRFASVMSDLHRAAGRTGMGAVMGSKNLKAIAARGKGFRNYADEKSLMGLVQSANKEVWEGSYGDLLYKYGTDGDLDDLHASGRLPTKAFQKGTFEDGYEKLTGETMAETILTGRHGCYACSIRCIREVETKEPLPVDPAYGGPEYETAAAFGSLCLNTDLVTVAKANELCNKHGIDTISTGVVIAFAMECYEKGLLTKKDSGGIELNWGNPNVILTLVESIAFRRGIGSLLAEGVKRAAKEIGRGAEDFALHIKGQELPMHEPRGKKGLGLSYAVSNRGACHLQAEHDDTFEDPKWLRPEFGLDKTVDRLDVGREKAKNVKILLCLWGLYDSLSVCKFTCFPEGGISLERLAEIVNAATGWRATPNDLLKVGERALNLSRAFNVREGFSRKDDTLPKRLMEPLADGPYKGQAITEADLNGMIDNLYEFLGWNNETGAPTRDRLDTLGIGYVADGLGLA